MPNRLNRREFFAAASATAASAVVSAPLIAVLPQFASAENRPRTEGEAGTAPDPMDADLLEVTIDKLHGLYTSKKYTVTQVTHWYLARIARYNPVYRAMIHVDTAGALAIAARQDAAAKAGGAGFKRSALWGVPIVVKSNTAIKGLVTSAGWYGYLVPGLENVAPQDAPVVAKLRAAGAVILGQTNMPDFAASDANYSTAYGRTGNAYNVRYSPGGSSGGTVTAIAANLAVLGTGTDTANSIRMPAATSSVVGVLPTRGLVSITGIQPLDWLRDNTGPIARTVRDTAIGLDVMSGEDPRDFRTKGSSAQAQSGPYTKYLSARSLAEKRFGVPAFMLADGGQSGGTPLRPETRALFMKALDGLRAAGATVVFDDDILNTTFLAATRGVNTRSYGAEGTETFLRDFGPSYYHSPLEYAQAVGAPMTNLSRGAAPGNAPPRPLASDPDADANFFEPQRRAVAAYDQVLDQFKLDGLVYPAIQMPPNDEVAELAAGGRSSGPHSNTGWVNVIGVPAISVPAGFYDNGLPFSLEFSAKRWRDGDLLGWVYAYEQQTKARKAPVLVERTR